MSKDKKNLVEDTEGLEDEIDLSPLLSYFNSEKGHELASRVLAIFEDIKKATIDNTNSHVRFEKGLQVSVIAVVIVASSILTFFGKFDSTLGVLFGSLVGYMFGKK